MESYSYWTFLADIENGDLKIEGDYEDIHSFIEVNLTERIGETGKKLHTAHSRNDQVAVGINVRFLDYYDALKSIE